MDLNQETKAFRELKQQLDASGYEGASGINTARFSELTQDERNAAEEWLVSALERGDVRAIAPLGALGTPRAVNALKKSLLKCKGPSVACAELAAVLFRLEKDCGYEEAFLKNLKAPAATVRVAVIVLMQKIGVSQSITSALADLMKSDSDEDVRFTAGINYLRLTEQLGWNEKPSGENKERLRALLSDDQDEWIRAAERIVNV